MKKCPQCAEKVRNDAKVCRYCGHMFPPKVKRPDPTPRESLISGGCAIILLLGIWLLISKACSSDPPPVREQVLGGNVPNIGNQSASKGAAQLSEADQRRVCRTAIADMNGRPPSIVRVVSFDNGITRVRYQRPSDRSVWTNECRFEGNRIIWRTVDAFGPGSGLGRWRIDQRDEVFTYSISGSRVSITTTFPGEPPSTETYTVR